MQCSLAVDLRWPSAGEPDRRLAAQSLGRLAVVASEICRDSGRLPDDGHQPAWEAA